MKKRLTPGNGSQGKRQDTDSMDRRLQSKGSKSLKLRMYICFGIILCIALLAILAPVFSHFRFDETHASIKNQGMSGEHFFGTDSLGRDIWTRVWIGTRVSLVIGIVCALASQLFGIAVGSASGYFGGAFDSVLMMILDVCVCIPNLVYITLFTLAIGPGMSSLILSISLSSWMEAARNARSRMFQYKQRDFVLSARAYGASSHHIIFSHIIPNIRGQIIVSIFSAIPRAIFAEAYLSFLSLGVPSPYPSLGQLCRDGMGTYRVYPYKLFIPSAVLCLIVLCLFLLSNDFQEFLEAKRNGGANDVLFRNPQFNDPLSEFKRD